jgi:serine/threonine-protein kinase
MGSDENPMIADLTFKLICGYIYAVHLQTDNRYAAWRATRPLHDRFRHRQWRYGEVWRARDKTLGREVAIKMLPEEFARDGDRVARLEREAKLLAALNHANIGAIYGLEESNGTRFLILELIEGDTLTDRIRRGPLPAQESLKLALQMAEALEAAHEKGVIHRDLKPAISRSPLTAKLKSWTSGWLRLLATSETSISPILRP